MSNIHSFLIIACCYGILLLPEGSKSFLLLPEESFIENQPVVYIPADGRPPFVLENADDKQVLKRVHAFTPRIGRKKRSVESALLERLSHDSPFARILRPDQEFGGLQLRPFIPHADEEEKRGPSAFTPRIGRTAFIPRIGR